MKNLVLLISICLFLSGICFAQRITEDKVPAPVKKEFFKKFPKATKSEWEIEKDDYEVTFIDNKTESSANFDKNGKLLETEFTINEKELPQAVKSSAGKNYAGYKINEISKIEKSDKSVFYEIELSKDKEKLEVLFSKKGDVVKRKDISSEKETK